MSTITLPSWANKALKDQVQALTILRDTYEGELKIKGKASGYLPMPSGMTLEDYALYLENATFYNMIARTVGAMVGTIYQRLPAIKNIPTKLEEKLKNISKSSESITMFSRTIAKEVIHVGRYGVLLDRNSDGSDPYVVGYNTESILDWSEEVINGRNKLTKVVLLEHEHKDGEVIFLVRVLELLDGVYQQRIYENVNLTGEPAYLFDFSISPTVTITPTLRGNPLDYIPFIFFGAESNKPGCERSGLLDIALLNISHYKSYAHLEHGRFFTGLPVFYVSKETNDGESEYTIGPSVVWEIGHGQKAGLLEFNGQGLKFLENALTSKEAQIASLGGRMIGVDTRSVSESDNQVAMKNRNESALLLNIIFVLDDGLTQLLRWWAEWETIEKSKADKISIEFSKDFLLKESSAREFRAIHAMWKDGLLPVEVVHTYLQKADVIPEWLELKEFKKMLESEDSFLNNPDVMAKQKGFPDAQAKLDEEVRRREAKYVRDNPPPPPAPPNQDPGPPPPMRGG